VRSGDVDEGYVDRAVLRVLAQKESLGLLDPEAYADEPPAVVDLDSPQDQALARKLAEESVVLLFNDGVLPLSLGDGGPSRIAVIGPNADRPEALQGCYSFANHVLEGFPGYPAGITIPTVYEALAAAAASGAPTEVVLAHGCAVEGDDRSGFGEAVAAAGASDVAVVVVGDQAGLFGRGTVGEGNDTDTLALPGVQRELVEAVVATGTPVVMVLLTGRPYAIGWALDGTHQRPAAVLQAFFPGEGGGLAIADILTGAVNPSGRLPVTLPRSAGAQPYSYLQPILGGPSEVTSTDPTPLRPFGFGLSYTTFTHTDLVVDHSVAAGGTFSAAITATNTGPVAGADVVQVYGRDVIGSVVRPVAQLLGYARVELAAGECRRITFEVPTTRLAFSDRRRVRIVEPGAIEVWVAAHAGASAEEMPSVSATNGAISNSALSVAPPVPGTATARACLQITGNVHEVSTRDPRMVVVRMGEA
jgi:beta-glucosidase